LSIGLKGASERRHGDRYPARRSAVKSNSSKESRSLHLSGRAANCDWSPSTPVRRPQAPWGLREAPYLELESQCSVTGSGWCFTSPGVLDRAVVGSPDGCP